MGVELSDDEKTAMTAMEDADKATPEPVEPESSQEAAEEVISETTEPSPKGDKGTRTVPHGALHEEREKRKAVERELQTAREERARFDERLRMIQEMNQPQQQSRPVPRRPEGEMPDPDSDPIGAMKWLAADRQAGEYERAVQGQQYQQAQSQRQAMDAMLQSAMQEYRQTVADRPEVQKAYEHYQQSRSKELASWGWNQQQIAQQLYQEDAQIVQNARRANRPLGDAYVSMAEARGWQKQAEQASAADKIATAADAQARGKSLSQVGGAAAVSEMTVERLLAMSNDDFSAWKVKHPKGYEKLMGA